MGSENGLNSLKPLPSCSVWCAASVFWSILLGRFWTSTVLICLLILEMMPFIALTFLTPVSQVLSLKSLWEDTVMEQNFQLVNDPIHHSTLMESISYRRHILNMVSTEFSKTYSSKPNGCHTFLFTGLRSGHVVLWTVKCPLLSQWVFTESSFLKVSFCVLNVFSPREDISLALVCKTGNSSVKVMRWCDVGHNKG